MAFFLEVRTGAIKGRRYLLREGMYLGRTTGDIVISDPKISSLHAQIQKDSDGGLLLVDKNSSNGLWLKDQKVESISLLPGVQFRIGRTEFAVFEEADVSQIIQEPPPELKESKEEDKKDRRNNWKSILDAEVPKLLAQNAEIPQRIDPFDTPVCLTFIAGPETDRKVVVGFGPRKFGSQELDIEICDPSAPGLAFELLPDGARAKIVCKSTDGTKLNHTVFTSAFLQEGDIISVGKTEIKIHFLDEASGPA